MAIYCKYTLFILLLREYGGLDEIVRGMEAQGRRECERVVGRWVLKKRIIEEFSRCSDLEVSIFPPLKHQIMSISLLVST